MNGPQVSAAMRTLRSIADPLRPGAALPEEALPEWQSAWGVLNRLLGEEDAFALWCARAQPRWVGAVPTGGGEMVLMQEPLPPGWHLTHAAAWEAGDAR